MSYVQKSLLPGERIEYAATLHWIVFLPGLIVTICGGALAHYGHYLLKIIVGTDMAEILHLVPGIIAAVIVFSGVFLLFEAYIRQNTTELAITDRRIIAKYGFMSSVTFELLLGRVSGATYDQTFAGGIFGYGTIVVHGAGGDKSPFDNIANPQGFHMALMTILGHVKSHW